MLYKWILNKKIPDEIVDLFPEINSKVLQILYNRKINQEDFEKFLNPEYEDLLNPFLFNDMEKVIKRVKKAVENQEKILIYGDYDVDGVTGSVILYETFKKILKVKDIEVYLPHREKEGYGLNQEVCKYIKNSDFSLVITIDCGITNNEEIKYLKDKGIDTIIMDHHLPPKNLPPAYAILNPKLKTENYPFKDLSACGVGFKFVQGLLSILKNSENKIKLEAFEKWHLDLVAISIIADMMPLLGENRILTKFGLIVLNKTKRKGLRELIKKAGINLGEIECWTIGYIIAPRLNAAGRVNHANSAFKLLILEDENEIKKLVEELEQSNKLRQKLTDEITQEVLLQLKKEKKETQKFLIASQNPEGKKWPLGVIGLVAGKISKIYFKPTIILGYQAEKWIGSGRSIPGFDIVKTIKHCEEYILKLGGHKSACGFTLKQNIIIKEFIQKLENIANEKIDENLLIPKIFIDCELEFNEIFNLIQELKKLSPFGIGNEEPIFITKNVEILGKEKIGQDNQHLKLVLKKDNQILKGIFFNNSNFDENLETNQKIDIAYYITESEWNGFSEVYLKIIDIKPNV